MNKCAENTCDPLKTLRENACSAIIVNPRRVEYCVVTVDGCEVARGQEACDYLVLHRGAAWYIELKGKDLEKALRQIASSMAALSGKYPSHQKIAVIVATRVPAIAGFQKAARKVAKAASLEQDNIILKSRKATIEID